MWKRFTKPLFLQEVWGQVSAGWSKGIWLETEPQIVGDEHRISWHVCGMEDAQWVGRLACTPGRLALPPALLPTAFPQLDCSG